MRIVVGIVALLVAIEPSLAKADTPAHYYCGGAVQYFAGSWWQANAPSQPQAGARPISGFPAACPVFSASWIRAGGLGDSPLSAVAVGGGIDNGGAYVSYTPQAYYGAFGILGQMLATYFSGPSFSPDNKMGSDLAQIRTLSTDMTQHLTTDTAFVASQLPSLMQRVAVDRGAIVEQSVAQSDLYRRALQDVNGALQARPAAPPSTDDGRLSAIVGLLETTSSVAAIKAGVPAENLRPSGTSMFGALDDARASSYGTVSSSVSDVRHERAKADAASVRYSDNSTKSAIVSRAQSAFDIADRFASSGSEAAATFVDALLSEARTDRYRADGILGYTMEAVVNVDGSVWLHRLPEGSQKGPDALTTQASNFILEQGALRVKLAKITPDSPELRYASGLLGAGDASYFAGFLREGQMLEAVGSHVMDAAASGSPTKLPPLGSAEASEVSEFVNSFGENAFNAVKDVDIDKLGALVSGIENLGAVNGLIRDLSSFNLAVLDYMQNPTAEKGDAIAQSALKFGFATTAGAFALAMTAGAPIVITIGATAAAGVAADYAAKAAMFYLKPRAKPLTNGWNGP